MALWNVYGQVVDDAQEGVRIPEGATRLATYDNPWQYTSEQGNRFQWEDWMPRTGEAPAGMNIEPGYINQLLAWADASEAGTLKDYERAQWEDLQRSARSVPLRQGRDFYSGWTPRADDPEAARLLNVNSPDIGHYMLTVRDKMRAGTATPQERALFTDTARQAEDWNYRASVPQESDANPFGLGDQLFGALATLGLGATGGLAAAPLFAGGAGLATTLGSLGTLSGIAGTGAGVLGQAMDQPWLSKLGLGLGALGGIAGGAGGLANLASRGVSSLGDVGKLLSSVGKITGAAGRATGNKALGQAGSYLGTAGQLGSGVDTLSSALGEGNLGGLAAGLGRVAGGVMPLLRAAQGAQQQAPMRPRPPQMRPPMPVPLRDEDWLRPGPAWPWSPPSVLANLRR